MTCFLRTSVANAITNRINKETNVCGRTLRFHRRQKACFTLRLCTIHMQPTTDAWTQRRENPAGKKKGKSTVVWKEKETRTDHSKTVTSPEEGTNNTPNKQTTHHTGKQESFCKRTHNMLRATHLRLSCLSLSMNFAAKGTRTSGESFFNSAWAASFCTVCSAIVVIRWKGSSARACDQYNVASTKVATSVLADTLPEK